jgi:hypothetical protein
VFCSRCRALHDRQATLPAYAVRPTSLGISRRDRGAPIAIAGMVTNT